MKPVIAIIGGTGALGAGLAKRWLAAGYKVVLGSRSSEKAESAARELGPIGAVRGAGNVDAAAAGDVVVIAVPFANHEATLAECREALKGKIVVDAVVPLMPPKVSTVYLPEQGSAALQAARQLSASTRVTSAFHNVGAAKLHAEGAVDCDILVFGDDKDARVTVATLADAIGARGIDGGVLANSVAAEALTAILIGINRRYKVTGAGIRITGLPAPAAT
jgi:NADPH-dependent F420 reductase